MTWYELMGWTVAVPFALFVGAVTFYAVTGLFRRRGHAFVDVVFDGPPGPEPGRFVECEDPSGKSVVAGRWIEKKVGADKTYSVLRIKRW